jgi:hypothetical protein
MIPSPERDAWLQAREALPGYRLMQQLRKYPIVRLLEAARKENSPAAYGELLEGLVTKLGVEAPDGVFLPVRRSRGAPRKTSTEQIYLVWLQNGKPGWAALAHLLDRADYTNANTQQRKKRGDSCRRAVARWQTELARQCGQDACD